MTPIFDELDIWKWREEVCDEKADRTGICASRTSDADGSDGCTVDESHDEADCRNLTDSQELEGRVLRLSYPLTFEYDNELCRDAGIDPPPYPVKEKWD